MKDLQAFKLDFIGIGTPKCGTEWITACLKEHPEVDFSKHKELNFFRTNITKEHENFIKVIDKLEDYPKQFENTPNKKRGEFSITYIYDTQALKMLKQTFPEVKVILVLRNPIDYLYSSYWYMKYSHVYSEVPDTFEEALEITARLKSTGNIPPYTLEKAKFYKYVKPCFEIFDRQDIHVIIYENLKQNPSKTIQELYKFIDVDETFKPKMVSRVVNKTNLGRFPRLFELLHPLIRILIRIGLGGTINTIINTHNPIRRLYRYIFFKKDNYPPMKENTKQHLKETLKEDIENLERLIQQDLSMWK